MALLLICAVVLLCAIALGMFWYVYYIPEPEGLSLASWPHTFTENFSLWLHKDGEGIAVEEMGLARLDEYGLWMQILDEEGGEVFSHNKPASYPDRYSSAELLSFATQNRDDQYTLFVSSFQEGDSSWNYIVGFPYSVGKYMFYYNGENLQKLSPLVRTCVSAGFAALVLFVIAYGLWLSKKLSAVTGGIQHIAQRRFDPLAEKGTFRQVYRSLNQLDAQIKNADHVREENEGARQEWIVNITHDLKTPLSPIKGYAELLCGEKEPDRASVQRYGAIILKNADHAEQLMDDLKLTYQLESGALPFRPQKTPLIRCLREWIIDLLNDPQFSGRDISFESDTPELQLPADPGLLRRAVQNILVNALVHNPLGTRVMVQVKAAEGGQARVCIRDDGDGLEEGDLAKLFSRYYRGTSTSEKPEGSGLGLAIAKQIILLHGGSITAASRKKEGTTFVITLPIGAN